MLYLTGKPAGDGKGATVRCDNGKRGGRIVILVGGLVPAFVGGEGVGRAIFRCVRRNGNDGVMVGCAGRGAYVAFGVTRIGKDVCLALESAFVAKLIAGIVKGMICVDLTGNGAGITGFIA